MSNLFPFVGKTVTAVEHHSLLTDPPQPGKTYVVVLSDGTRLVVDAAATDRANGTLRERAAYKPGSPASLDPNDVVDEAARRARIDGASTAVRTVAYDPFWDYVSRRGTSPVAWRCEIKLAGVTVEVRQYDDAMYAQAGDLDPRRLPVRVDEPYAFLSAPARAVLRELARDALAIETGYHPHSGEIGDGSCVRCRACAELVDCHDPDMRVAHLAACPKRTP